MVDGKGAVTPELKAAAEEGKVELPAELEPAKEQVEAIIIHKSQRVQIRDKAKEVSVELQKDVTLDPAFQALWDRIRQRTRFQVEVDSGKLIEHAIEAVDGMLAVRPPQVTSERASLGIDDAGVSAEGTGTSPPATVPGGCASSNAASASGGYSRVRSTVHSTAPSSTAPPK